MRRRDPLQEGQQTVVPIPDPTHMTRAAMDRDQSNIKELIDLRVHEREEVTEAHFKAIDKQFEHMLYQIRIQAKECNELVVTLKELMQERIRALEAMVEQRDKAWKESQDAAKLSVSFQQEANSRSIDKAQASSEKQLESLRTEMSAEKKSSDDKVDDLRNRLTSMESSARGSKETVATSATSNMNTASIIGIVIAAALGLASFIITLIQTMRPHS